MIIQVMGSSRGTVESEEQRTQDLALRNTLKVLIKAIQWQPEQEKGKRGESQKIETREEIFPRMEGVLNHVHQSIKHC